MEEAFNKLSIETKSSDEAPSPSKGSQDKCHWKFLEHTGQVFQPPYQRLEGVKFKYDGETIPLNDEAEEFAGLYALKRNTHLCAQNKLFQDNFLTDWHKLMTKEQQEKITDLSKCNFDEIGAYIKERNKNTKQDNTADKTNEYCIIDGYKEKIGNKVDKPDLFCPIGDNPDMGKIKKRIQPQDVTINCSEDSKIPEAPDGQKWNATVHYPTKAWIASYKDELQDKKKYIYLDQSSEQEQKIFRAKYETARELHKHIATIRSKYRSDWLVTDLESKERGIALYFIDTLALRPGSVNKNEAATTGCCTLKCKHIELCEDNYVHFNFLGKSSVRYNRRVKVEKEVYENLECFLKDKHGDKPLFKCININKVHNYLKNLNLMANLTPKVIRTYRACFTFEENLNKLTLEGDTKEKKLKAFEKANLEVAKLCNHKYTERSSLSPQKANRDEDKQYNLYSSKDDYIDPRIVVVWCLKNDIPIEKVYDNILRAKFNWAIEEIKNSNLDFVFCDHECNE